MPTVPKATKCATLGCQNPKARFSANCVDHGGKDTRTFNQKHNQSRKEFNAMYSTRQWQALRQIQLSKNPLCAGCLAEGIVTAASVVDHVFPWAHISKEAFFVNRFQSLCQAHHAEKTQLEQHGTYRRWGTPTVDYTKGDYPRLMGMAP